MKKRILSVLLLLAMLVTMIPVTAAAAEVAATDGATENEPQSEAPAAGDLQEWYVKDGLTHLFTTFGDENGVDLAAGTWTAKVGTGAATLGTKARWSVGEFGGIGFDVLYGTVDAEGAYTTESTFNNHHVNGLKLNFGISLLPAGDLTVEYLAMYKPIYVADTDGSILVKEGAKVEAYDAFEGALPSGALSSKDMAIDNIGWYSSYTNRIDGVCTVYPQKGRGQTFWCFDNPTWYAGQNGWRYQPQVQDDPYQTNNAIRMYSVTLSEKLTIVPTEQTVLDEEGNPVLDGEGNETTEIVDVRKTDASFGVYRDAALYYNKLNASTANAEGGTYYYDIDTAYAANAGFSLSNSRPTDFFAVRVYDRALSAGEMRINRMVDLLLYYGIELTEAQIANTTLRNILSNTLAGFALETNSAAKEATKTSILAAIAAAEADAAYALEYAAPEHLTALFSVYADGTLDLAKGTWRNLIGGANATFGTNWTEKANGAFGFDMWAGYKSADGTYTPGKTDVTFPTDAYISNNDPTTSGYALNLGLSNLSTEDFTVEYQALYRPVLVADASKSTADTLVYYEENGEYLAAYDIDGNNSIPDVVSWACDVFGWFSTRTMNTDGGSGWSNSKRGTVHWMVGHPKWGSGSNYKFVTGGWATGMYNKAGEALHKAGVNSFFTYSVSVDETVTAAGDTEARLAVYRNAEMFGNNYAAVNSTANKVIESDKGTAYYDYGKGYPTQTDFSGKYTNSDYNAYFYLSAGTPTDFLTVRVYDTVLSDADQKFNMGVDAMHYYGITLTAEQKKDPVLYGAVIDALASAELVGNAAAKAAKAAELEATIDAVVADIAYVSEYAAAEDMTALFTVYAPGTVDLENGTWRNLLGSGNATIGNKDQWEPNADGSFGFDMYYGTYINETYAKSVSGDGTSNYFTYGTRLTLGINLLPADDFTLEYLAQYKPYYVTDGEGNLVYDENGNAIETYVASAGKGLPTQDPGGSYDRSVMRVGYLNALTYTYDGAWGNGGGSRGSGTRWTISGTASWGSGNSCTIDPRSAGTEPFISNAGVRTYSITREEVGESNVYAATYRFLRDGVVGSTHVYDANTVVDNGNGYVKANFSIAEKDLTGAGDANRFWLSERHGTNFYTIRIYDRVLTEAERKFNIGVDAAHYYGITIPADVKKDEALLGMAMDLLSNATFVTDAAAKAAKKLELETAIASLVEKKAIIDSYAASENLTALYTVFADGTVNLANGTWTDLVAGQTAKLYTANASTNNWKLNADGSVGFDMLIGELDATGAYTAFNTQKAVDIRLEFGIAQLPEGDFTVEYAAQYKPVYLRDSAVTDKYVAATDANGNPIETYSYNQRASGLFVTTAIDHLGWFTSVTTMLDGQMYRDWAPTAHKDDDMVRGMLHWHYSFYDGGWYGSWQGAWVGPYGNSAQGGLSKLGDSYQTNGQIRNYAIILDETVTVSGEDRVTTANLMLYRDSALYNSSEKEGKLNSTANGTTSADKANDPYVDVDTPYASGTKFWLSNRRPTDFYAVRVYDKALTEAELQYNHMIDLLYFYDIELPEEIAASEELKAQLAGFVSGIEMTNDPFKKSAALLAFDDAVESVLSTELYELYVQDGLTSHFSALTPSDSSVSVANGTWQNRVAGGASASLGNSALWTRNANGSFGFNLFYGELSDEGVYNATSKYTTFNHDTSLGTNLNFGIEQLPADDFTVEYVAQYKPIYVADKFGNVALDENGDPVEAYSYGNVKMKDPGSINIYGAELRIGYLANYVYPTDGNWGGSAGNPRGDGMWTISSAASWPRSNSAQFTTAGTAPVKSNVFTENAGVRTYAITRAEDKDNTACAVYNLIREGVVHTTKEFDSSKVVPNVNNYAGVDFSVAEKDLPASITGENLQGSPWQSLPAKYFYISERRPTDFYAVRIYDRVLSTEELAQNHLIDIVIYYGLELDEQVFENTAMGKKILKDCATALNTAEIATDAFTKAANREEYQAALDLAVFNASYVAPSNYDELYATRGLVALYTAFAGDQSADVVNGVWANKAADQTYGAATLNGAWMKEANGIGYRIEAETISELRTQATKHGISLNDNLANLDNFTVEVFAKVYGATDADGNRVKFASEPFISHRNNFRFGMLTSLGFSALYGSTGLVNRWAITNIEHTGSNWTIAQAFNPDAAAKYGKTIDDNGWYKMGTAVPTPGIMTATKATAANGDVSYAVSYNNATTAAVSFDVPKATHDALALVTSSDDITGRKFSLFNTMPATVYAVRVYSRELTTAEAIQNSFADKAAYYQLDVDDFNSLSTDKKNDILSLFTTIDMNRNAEDVQALYDFYAQGAAEELTKTTVSFTGIEPILANASGYRALFQLNKSAYDLLVAAGYDVTFGALVAPGGVYNDLADVVVGASGVKNIQVGGEGGSGVYYNLHGAKGWYYSAAITADDAAFYGVDMIVRGYISATKGGETITVYDDASLNGDAQVSVLDAADYFVNMFDGDLATQYKYMNSAALRAILAASDYTARVGVGDDIVIYVDAANGADTNDGLSEAKPYKTLNAAFAAAKAHFAQAGRKTAVISLKDGVYTITEELSLTADEILADAYALEVIGSANTEINALVDIDYDHQYEEYLYDDDGNIIGVDVPGDIKTDAEGYNYIQLPDVGGTYPQFRAVYADGALLDIAHIGTQDQTYNINDFYILDAEGNELEAVPSYDRDRDGDIDADDGVSTDWALSSTDYQKAVWGVFTLPAEMFPVDPDFGITYEDYEGAELHFAWIWETSAVHIDHVEAIADDDSNVRVYVAFGQFPSAYKGGNKVVGREAWLENALVLSAMGGGYYYNAASGRFYYPEADLSEIGTLSYAGLDNIFVFKGLENITIRNLSITGLDSNYLNDTEIGMHLGQAGGLTLRSNDKVATAIGHIEHAAIYGENLTGLTVQNVNVYDVLGAGVTVKGLAKNITVDSSKFTNIGGSAIQISHNSTLGGYAKNITITNNYINLTGQLYGACASVMTGHTAGAKIIGNTVIGSTWSAFALGQSWAAPTSSIDDLVNGGQVYTFDLEVAYNYVTDMMTITGDGGAFYLNGAAVSIASDDSAAYNYLHHNYVVMSDVSGLRGENENDWRNTYCYYFENSTSNWLSYENVLLNEVNNDYPAATFLGVYLQTYEGGEARNIEMVDNYFVGFEHLVDVYKGSSTTSKNPQADFGQSASDYVYASVNALANDTAVVETHQNAVSKASKAGAGEAVAAIFGAAGSDLSDEGKQSYLTAALDATPAADRFVRKDGELVKVENFGEVELIPVVFTDGETTITTKSLEGATVKAPGAFALPSHNYTYYMGGKVVDLATLKVEAGMTITVVAEEKVYDIVVRGEVAGDTVISLPEGAALTLPESLVRPGKTAVLVYDGVVVDLDTFKMPAMDIEMRISYVNSKYEVTFVDPDGLTGSVGGEYGDIVSLPRAFTKAYHTTVYKVDGVEIQIGKYTIPEGDVTINVEYVPNEYEVFFKVDLTDVDGATIHTYGSVMVTYGAAIDASAIDTSSFELAGYTISFNGWKNFESGVTKLLADGEGNLLSEVYADYKIGSDDFATGDFNGDGGEPDSGDMLLLAAAVAGKTDKYSLPGADLNNDGEIDSGDMLLLAAAVAGKASLN